MTPPPIETVRQRLEQADCKIKGEGQSFQAQCPAHDDRTPSLSVKAEGDKVLVHCHTGCDTQDIMAALGLTMSHLYEPSLDPLQARPRQVPAPTTITPPTDYVYLDADGEPWTKVKRTLDKRFIQYRWEDGRWKPGLDGRTPVPYKLPDVVQAVADGHGVVVVEGEKDAERLASEGIVATTSPMGAGKWRDSYAEHFAGATVVIIPDNDKQGIDHARQVSESLQKVGANVSVLELDDVPPKGDVSDLLDAGNTVEQLRAALNSAPSFADWQPDPPDDEPPLAAVLEFQKIGAMAAEVDAAGQAEWMLRRIWPQGDYGVHGAEEKAQKSWSTFDLAVSVASGTPWLGHVPVDVSGPVVMFVGEGSKRNTVRRLRGIADERGVLLEELPIYVCVRAPNLASEVHLQEFEDVVADVRPTLVTLDPLYLAAQGADGGNIYGMGAVLQRGQHICQRHGASLWVVHHNNRTGRKGGRALSGAGPAEWGRVLLTAEVKSRRTDPETQETDVTTELAVIGGEVADQKLRVRRRIRAEDPDDLSSRFHIVTETTDADTPRTASAGPLDNLPPGALGLLEAAKTDPERGWTLRTLNDKKGDLDGIYLKRETASRYLNQMERAGLIGGDDPEPFEEKVWWLSARVTSRDVVEDHATETTKSSRDARDVTRDDHTGGGANPRVTSPNPLGDVTRNASTTSASKPDGKEAA